MFNLSAPPFSQPTITYVSLTCWSFHVLNLNITITKVQFLLEEQHISLWKLISITTKKYSRIKIP